MYVYAVRAMIRRAIARLNAGEIGPLLASFTADVQLRFPGQSSWGRDYNGRPEVEGFLRRFTDLGLQYEIEDILVAGWPWNTRVAVRFTDEGRDADGSVFYRNGGVEYATVRWGKIRSLEVFLDTQKVAALDDRLASTPTGTARVGAA